MSGSNLPKQRDDYSKEEIKATLEKKYIEEYLRGKGYRREDLRGLSKEETKQLMTEASVYASLKLTYIESRAHFRNKIHWHF